MTHREKVLATTLLGALVIFGGGAVFYLFVYEPISEVSTDLRTTQEQLLKKRNELKAEEDSIGKILKVNPRLTLWNEISVPPRDPELAKNRTISPEEQKRKHLNRMQVEYERYLSELLRSSGFRSDSIVVTARQPDRRSTSMLKGKEQPVYERLAFNVTAKGTYTSATRMMRDFYRTKLLHQIRSVTLALPTKSQVGTKSSSSKSDQLDLNMTVEALMVNGAKDRVALLPDSVTYPPRVLAEGDRDYFVMVKKNMFTGYDPPRPPAGPRVERKTEEPTKPKEDRKELLAFVRLTTIFWNPDRRRWEATLYDQLSGPRRVTEDDEETGEKKVTVIWEKKLNARILRELTLYDKYNNKMIDATVVYLGETEMIIKEDKKYYRLKVGDALYPAIDNPLSEKEIKEYGF